MKTIRIKATVGNTYAPKNILVFISNLDDHHYDKYFESQKSFDQEFEASTGDYTIKVIGMNHPNDTTTVSVSGDFQLEDTKSSDDENYVLVFMGEVN